MIFLRSTHLANKKAKALIATTIIAGRQKPVRHIRHFTGPP
ncbi:hypothetical protein [Mucilaginibacter straminoryzae]|nr:hypothetical protein [Mucilaginibacter straminoryzae]